MAYTVWLDGEKIGETAFDLRHGQNRRGGIFHPTELGLTILPRITAMGPALLDIGRLCQENGIDADDPNLDLDDVREKLFETPVGDRIMEAGELISRMELHSSAGELVPWESLLISDMNELAALGGDASPAQAEATPERSDRDPVRYFISATLKRVSFTRRLRMRRTPMS